jgi:dethiobiotin synthetase
MAARKEGAAVDIDVVADCCSRAAAAHRGTLFIEGVGGVMVPLDERRTVLDLMQTLGLPVLLVAGSYLGTFSHTLTALDAIRRRGLRVLAVVVNETAESPLPLEDTVETIARFSHPSPAIALPRLRNASADHPAFARIADLL